MKKLIKKHQAGAAISLNIPSTQSKLYYSDIPMLDYTIGKQKSELYSRQNDIKINDDRNVPSNKKLNPNISSKTAKAIIEESIKKGLNPSTVLAMSLQEGRLSSSDYPLLTNGKTFPSGEIEDVAITAMHKTNNWDYQRNYIRSGLDLIKEKMDYAKSLGKTTDADTIQSYNGYGKIKGARINELGQRGDFGMYGTKDVIDMNKVPKYGERIIDLRENVIKKTPEILSILNKELSKRTPKHQAGATINSNILKPSTLTEEQLSTRIKDWRQSPEWHAQATGRVEAPPLDPIDLLFFGGLPKAVMSSIATRSAAKLAAARALPSVFRGTTINMTHPRSIKAANVAQAAFNKVAGKLGGGATATTWDTLSDNVDYSKKLIKK